MDIQILKDGQDMGTYPVEQVNQHLEGGMFEATDLGWHEGMADWAQLSEIAGVVLQEQRSKRRPRRRKWPKRKHHWLPSRLQTVGDG